MNGIVEENCRIIKTELFLKYQVKHCRESKDEGIASKKLRELII